MELNALYLRFRVFQQTELLKTSSFLIQCAVNYIMTAVQWLMDNALSDRDMPS